MTEGPSKREVERVREAMERHDSELREDEVEDEEQPDETSEEQDEEG